MRTDVASENNAAASGEASGWWFETALLPDGWAENVRVTASDGVITSVERNVPPATGDLRHAVGLPGLANVHSHAFQRGMAGLAEVRGPAADSFWTWREIMYRFLDRITPEDLEALATLAFVEMVESGFTRVGEFHYVHHDGDGKPYANPGELAERVCSAAQTAGIGLTLLPSFYAHGGFRGQPPTAGQRRFVTSLDTFAQLLEGVDRAARRLPGANVGVAPHSLRAVTSEELRHLSALSGDRPMHLHAAEQIQEVEDCLAATGARPVEWLLDHLPLDSRWCLVHATHLTSVEIERLAQSGATVALCPITEANLGDGIFPAAPFLAHGGHFGIGSDSNVQIDAAAELRALEYSQRLANRTRNVLAPVEGTSTGRSLFERALTGGNRALQVPAGGLAAGSPADIVTLAADCPALAERERGDAILDRFIFGGRGGHAIQEVWVRGKRLVVDGCHAHREQAQARFRAAMRRILSA